MTYKKMENKMLKNLDTFVDKAETKLEDVEEKDKLAIAGFIANESKSCVLCGGSGVSESPHPIVTAPLLLSILPYFIQKDEVVTEEGKLQYQCGVKSKALYQLLSSKNTDRWNEFFEIAYDHLLERNTTFETIVIKKIKDGGEPEEEKEPLNPKQTKAYESIDAFLREKKAADGTNVIKDAAAKQVAIARKKAKQAKEAEEVTDMDVETDETTQPQHVAPLSPVLVSAPSKKTALTNHFNFVDETNEEPELDIDADELKKHQSLFNKKTDAPKESKTVIEIDDDEPVYLMSNPAPSVPPKKIEEKDVKVKEEHISSEVAQAQEDWSADNKAKEDGIANGLTETVVSTTAVLSSSSSSLPVSVPVDVCKRKEAPNKEASEPPTKKAKISESSSSSSSSSVSSYPEIHTPSSITSIEVIAEEHKEAPAVTEPPTKKLTRKQIAKNAAEKRAKTIQAKKDAEAKAAKESS